MTKQSPQITPQWNPISPIHTLRASDRLCSFQFLIRRSSQGFPNMWDSEQKKIPKSLPPPKKRPGCLQRKVVLSSNENMMCFIYTYIQLKMKNTIADMKNSIGWVGDKVEEIFESGTKRQRQKVGENIRIFSLVQECIICKEKDFYKEKKNL